METLWLKKVQIATFWILIPCSLFEFHPHFEETFFFIIYFDSLFVMFCRLVEVHRIYSLNPYGHEINRASYQQDIATYVPSKRWWTSAELHGVTSHEMVFVVVTAKGTAHPVYLFVCWIWGILSCSLINVKRLFGWTYGLHLQVPRVSQARDQRD
jgi:hypothetical protein